MAPNQNPEQVARDQIDAQLRAAGWVIGDYKRINVFKTTGVAVREYRTDDGKRADYVLFVDGAPVGVIEAKKATEGFKLVQHEGQSTGYALGGLKFHEGGQLRFVFESTGTITRFTDLSDPKPRAREIFHFFRPETLQKRLQLGRSLRDRLQDLPGLDPTGLRPAQIDAIQNLEVSFKDNRPRALIQMATGAGKTFTATTFAYRLLKHARAERILFLVDTRNLGEQAEGAFTNYQPRDTHQKFSELYNTQRLTSHHIAPDSQVCISTIQRMYSILQGEPLDEQLEEENPNERHPSAMQAPPPVAYNPKVPPETFDFIVIDECHRSIYNLWRQVLDYFDAFLVGLTATPDKRTFGFFEENVVSEYTYMESVADGVNVPNVIYTMETEITQAGAKIRAEEYVHKREKMTRKMRWERLENDFEYTPNQLDKDVVNKSTIRNIIREFRQQYPTWYPERKYVPKTLIFAKTDSHASDIIEIVRKEFGEGNEFCKKITYKAEEKPKDILRDFRNRINPRIAVTVDMVATGTDVKPLEILIFMRDVRSSSYFEQMLGRGTRTIDLDSLKKASPSARHAKTHFVVVDAVGATKSKKTEFRPLERKRSVPLKDLLSGVAMGDTSEATFSSLAGRLLRLDKQLTESEKERFEELAEGKELKQVARELLAAHDPDAVEAMTRTVQGQSPDLTEEAAHDAAQKQLIRRAARTFSGQLNDYIENVRRVHEQVIDSVNLDRVTKSEWDSESLDRAKATLQDFRSYIEAHKDEITALKLFYGEPYQRRELTFKMVKDLLDRIKLEKPTLVPAAVWAAYGQVEQVRPESPKSELVALVSLLRRVVGLDAELTPFTQTVDRKFQDWVFGKQAGKVKYNPDQMEWLRALRDHIAESFHVSRDDLELHPFGNQGGLGRMYQLFGAEMDGLLDELNEVLVA